MIYLADIPGKALGKARPRVSHGHAYLPAPYRAWKQRICLLLRGKGPASPLTGTVHVTTLFYTRTGNMRSDCDNAMAAILDCLQDAGWIKNDRQVKAGRFALSKAPFDGMHFMVDDLRAAPEHPPTTHIRRASALQKKGK